MGELFPFEQAMATSWPPETWSDHTVLLCVSGGADSVALFRAIERIHQRRGPGRVLVAHYNHRLRGEEADADEAFVVALCQSRSMPCVVERREGEWTDAPDASEGIEAAARALRHRFFLETAKRLGARQIVTAHTADDQVETILHRIIRGTGVAGLAGIPRTREVAPGIALIRPMLAMRRTDVLEYLQAIAQPFRVDSTNHDVQFTRNRIRHVLLPQLREEFNATADAAVGRLGRLAAEAQEVIDRQTMRLLDAAVRVDGPARAYVLRAPLIDEPPYLVREVLLRLWREMGWPLRAMGLQEWLDMTAMLFSETTERKRVFPGDTAVESTDEGLLLSRPESTSEEAAT